MGRVLLLGAGRLGEATAQRMINFPTIFTHILLASRTKAKCDAVAEKLGENKIETAQVDAYDTPQLIDLIERFKPDLVINMAPLTQYRSIMEACLETDVSYLDTANYASKRNSNFEYKWQWAYQNRFREAGLMAILGCSFDSGLTGVFTAFAAQRFFDEILQLDIINGKQSYLESEIEQLDATFWHDGEWKECPKHQLCDKLNTPELGELEVDLIYNTSLKSLVKNFPTIKKARFWITQHPEITIGCRVRGLHKGLEKELFIYNNNEFNDNTTGISVVIGAMLFLSSKWKKPGVFNVEQLNPKPFMNELAKQDFKWHEILAQEASLVL
ncbi:saccharopine dehydrogenase family protein [Prolixibacteraceae bacterium JC049]|nr:saccharopine dehydrogenase family protein [Prolixibacteraceae bacterium JC049]